MKASMLRKSNSWLSVLIITVMLFGLYPGVAQVEAASSASGKIYYVDHTAGNDGNTGTAESSPWKTMGKVNSTVFKPGDRILLKSGSVWNNQTLAPQAPVQRGTRSLSTVTAAEISRRLRQTGNTPMQLP